MVLVPLIWTFLLGAVSRVSKILFPLSIILNAPFISACPIVLLPPPIPPLPSNSTYFIALSPKRINPEPLYKRESTVLLLWIRALEPKEGLLKTNFLKVVLLTEKRSLLGLLDVASTLS